MTRRFSDALVDVQAYGNQRAGQGRVVAAQHGLRLPDRRLTLLRLRAG